MKKVRETGKTVFAANHFERLNYFFGKLLTVRDFKAEQSYLNEKRWLLNRYAIGSGVLCGLEVKEDPNSEHTGVIIQPGMALDRYGNEIWVHEDIHVEVCDKIEPPATAPPAGHGEDWRTYYVAIRYKECLAEPVPAPVKDCDTATETCYYCRVREMYEWKVFEDDPPETEKEKEVGCAGLTPEYCDDYVKSCPPRPKCEWMVLAKVMCGDEGIIRVENRMYRRSLWSNEFLADCLEDTVHISRSARVDRRQFVPLLAQTIKGVEFRDGRINTITSQWGSGAPGKPATDVGRRPYDITTDGDYIWFTDAEVQDYSVIKLTRDGQTVDRLPVNKKSHSIAYDGCYMWITHPETAEVSIISKSASSGDCQPLAIELEGCRHSRDIVYTPGYMWVASENRITCINVIDHDTVHTDLDFTPLSMAFDGTYIWIVYRKDNGMGEVCKIDPATGDLVPGHDPIPLGDEDPRCIVYDGTHMWVTHGDGITQIDINENEREKKASTDDSLTGAAFDGMYLWAAEPESKKIHRYDIFRRVQVSEFRPTEDLEGPRHFQKMCFDGQFVWITDFTKSNAGPVGVIHRLLV